jgi:3'(2'), 5'-bisphosphate nucleotidase
MTSLDDAALAALAAERAGQRLIELRAGSGLRAEALGQAGDSEANAIIVALLREHRPDDALLSEELAPDPARLQRSRVWIVDPLDGTREYSEPGNRTDWAVHVALCIDGAPAASAVALPALKELWRSDQPLPPVTRYSGKPPDGVSRGKPPDVVSRGKPPDVVSRGKPRVVVSRTRPPALAEALAQQLDGTLLRIGSAGAKAMAVVRGDAELYVHAGGMNEWDACAPVGVALAHGLVACRFDGSACRFNQPDAKTPDLLIGRAEWVERARALLPTLGVSP